MLGDALPINSIFRSLFARDAKPSGASQVWSAPADGGESRNLNGGGGGGSSTPWETVISRLQQRRNSHVIGLIHRHQDPREYPIEWYFDAVIGETHAEDFITALGHVPPTDRLDVILHSVGAFTPPLQQIARAIKAHKGETTVFVPYYAHSLSTLIAAAADNVVMGSSASLSFAEFSDLEAVARTKGIKRTADGTIMRANLINMFTSELKEFVCELNHGGAHGANCPLANDLVGTKRSGANPITPAAARKIGLNVSTDMPTDVFMLIRACRAAPLRDHGVKTAERVMASVAQASASTGLLPDVARGLTGGFDLAAPAVRRAEPRQHAAEDDEDDDDHLGGVALENCDITIRPFIAKLEQARGSRVICVIHQAGMESDSVDTATTEDILSAMQLTPPDMPIDLILHTPGGYSFQSKQIAYALKAHKARKTVFIPYFAMSGGTIIALAADEIVLAPHAVLGPIDTQYPVHALYGFYPARQIVRLSEKKPNHRIHDELVDLANRCRKTIAQDHKDALELMQATYGSAAANRIAHKLNDGDLTHGYPLTAPAAAKLGLKISRDMPVEVMQIVRAFRRNRNGKRSVVYCV